MRASDIAHRRCRPQGARTYAGRLGASSDGAGRSPPILRHLMLRPTGQTCPGLEPPLRLLIRGGSQTAPKVMLGARRDWSQVPVWLDGQPHHGRWLVEVHAEAISGSVRCKPPRCAQYDKAHAVLALICPTMLRSISMLETRAAHYGIDNDWTSQSLDSSHGSFPNHS